MSRCTKWTMIYWDYSNGPKCYVRLTPLETDKFSHGLALAQTFDNEEDANKFADAVDEYMETVEQYHFEDRLESKL